MKAELRQQILTLRNQLSDDEVAVRSNQLKQRLFAMDEFQHASTVLFYVSYGREVRTHEMIVESLDLKKRVVVPKAVPESHSLVLSELLCWDDLCKGSYHILEPKKECIREIPSDMIELIIVPGVVFDRRGNRIGHGLGYYDRLLGSCLRVKKIGLAYDFQLVEQLPTESHDVQMDYIITESEIVSISSA